MNTTTVDTEAKKEARRRYMREYKRKYYARNKEALRQYQCMYYHNNNNNNTNAHTSLAELKQFTVMPGEFAKVMRGMNKIMEKHPVELRQYLTNYLDSIQP